MKLPEIFNPTPSKDTSGGSWLVNTNKKGGMDKKNLLDNQNLWGVVPPPPHLNSHGDGEVNPFSPPPCGRTLTIKGKRKKDNTFLILMVSKTKIIFIKSTFT